MVLLLAQACGEDPLWVYDMCEAGVAPDEACYAQKRAPSSSEVALATQIALSYIGRHPPEQVAWDWGEGVLMFSLTELYRVTRDARLREYTRAWLSAHIKKGYEIKWSDSCPPALSALALAQEDAGLGFDRIVADTLAYYKAAPRTDEGGISHLGKALPMLKTLWVDSLFMVGVFIARQAERAGDAELLASVGEQFAIFGRLLQGSSGWFKHAHNWPGQDAEVFWGRGNGWVSAAGHEYLRVRVLRGEPSAEVEAALSRHTQAVQKGQDPTTGLFYTVLNRPGESYLETSASALFAYGLARGFRYGLRGPEVLPVIARALVGVRAKVKTDSAGTLVTGISGPTMAGSASYYASIPLESDLHFGVGAVILALLESSGLPPGP